MMPAQTREILEYLRSQTRSLHDCLDHHALMQDLMSPGVTLATYRSILSKFLGFYRTWEPVLAGQSIWDELGIDFSLRLKTPALLADIERLDLTAADVKDAPGPIAIQNAATALGTFYVMEGATLGGQVIARHITQKLGLKANTGLAFFSSYGCEVPLRWQETRKALVIFCEQTGENDAVVAAAKETFVSLASWLDF